MLNSDELEILEDVADDLGKHVVRISQEVNPNPVSNLDKVILTASLIHHLNEANKLVHELKNG